MATRRDYAKSLAIVELAVAMLLALPCCVFLKVILFPPRGDWGQAEVCKSGWKARRASRA